MFLENLLLKAARKGKTNKVQILCELGANIEANDYSGQTALHFAAMNGHFEIARVLCEQGANIEATDNSGNTALFFAAYWGNTEIVRYLCEQGANTDAVNKEGYTALSYAAINNQVDAARVLLSFGANYDIQNIDGETAFDFTRNNDLRELISHQMICDRKPSLEVAFSAHCYFEEPSELLPYPKGQEHTDDGTRYAMGIIAQLKSANDAPNPIMQHILSYLPSMTGNKPAECMEIVANRKKPTTGEEQESRSMRNSH